MTWAYVKETGNGDVALRFVIEGLDREFVTDEYLAGAGSDGRVRCTGFLGNSFMFSEKCDLTNHFLDCEGFTAQIADVEETGTLTFGAMPTGTTYLAAALSTASASMTVLNTAPFTAGDYIHVATECMSIVTVVDATTLTVGRGKRDTTTQAHYTNDGENLRSPEVTNAPVSIEGRRVYVYAYGNGETGDGTLIYRGVCATDARLSNSTTWEITVDPISSLFDQQIGLDLDEPVSPRGILYQPGSDLGVHITMHTGTAPSSSPAYMATFSLAAELGTSDYLGGVFFETQEEFCDALNGLIVSKTALFGSPYSLTSGSTANEPTLKAVPDGTTGWHLEYKTGTTQKWCSVNYWSPIDCNTQATFSATPNAALTRDGEAQTVVAASTTYVVPRVTGDIPGAGTVPRGFFNGNFYSTSDGHGGTRIGATSNIIPLGGSIVPSVSSALAKVQWPECGSYPEEEVEMEVVSIDGTYRFVQLRSIGDSVGLTSHPWTSVCKPSIRFSRILTHGNIWDFLAAIMSDAPDGGNIGRVPFIISDEDVAASVSQTTIDSLASRSPIMSSRTYGQFKPMKLREVIEPEILLLGAVMSTDSNGRIVFRKLQASAATEASNGAITSHEQLDFPPWERNSFGSVNTVVLKTGWDPREDSYNGRTFIVRDVGSLGRNKTARKLEIEPKSFIDGDDAMITDSDVTALTAPIVGLLGYPYDTVTVKVPLTCFDLFVGDNVTLTSAQVPNSIGSRGINAGGIVIGRKWSPYEGTGEVTLLVSLQNIAGYAPTWRVTASSGSNPYTLTVAASGQPDGYATIADMRNGDMIQVAAIDTTSPTVRTSTVAVSNVNVGAETFQVTLSGALPAGTLNVDYQSATAPVQVSQQVYAFQAASNGVIDFTPTDAAARTISP